MVLAQGVPQVDNPEGIATDDSGRVGHVHPARQEHQALHLSSNHTKYRLLHLVAIYGMLMR
jgi:hypothetical protein